jgi:cell cycle sensor histidine kinase DivJ
LALLAMLIIGLPALIGAIWRPKGMEKSFFLGVWALAAAATTTIEGGVGAPLAVWCVMPAIVTIVLEAPWLCGVGLSVASLLAAAVLQGLHLSSKAPQQPLSFWLSLVAVLTTAGGAVGAMAVARQRARLARQGVEDELAAFQAMMGDLPELAFVLDPEGHPQAVFGRPLEGLDTSLLHVGLVEAAQDADKPGLQAAIRQAHQDSFSSALFTPDAPGSVRLLVLFQRTAAGALTAIVRHAPEKQPRAELSYTPLAAPAQTASPLTGDTLTDLSRRLKDAEAGRAKAEADAQGRAAFLANMSHELRTPLNAIMGFSDVMRAKMFGDLPPKYAEYAELIHESGRHLLDLINDVLDMSKIEAQRYELSREVFDVRDPVNASLRLLRLQADEVGVRLRGLLPAEALEVDADRRAIKQIVLNLVSNALKFTPREGLVTVTAQARGGALELIVSDTGVGIAPEDVARLGKPYEQAGGPDDRAQGTGLGLSLVAAFARLHGGDMSIESRLGEGAAITVRMPVLVKAAAPASADGEEGPASGEVADFGEDAADPLARPS